LKVKIVLAEIARLRQLRALGLPVDLFRDLRAKLVTHYRQRAASEPPRELRRHPPTVRHTLLAARCWEREREITDNLVELLIHIAHRIGVRAEHKVNAELLKHVRKVAGKTRLLFQLAAEQALLDLTEDPARAKGAARHDVSWNNGNYVRKGPLSQDSAHP
jgi:hypothetical protein